MRDTVAEAALKRLETFAADRVGVAEVEVGQPAERA
jgi:hypothetical protein